MTLQEVISKYNATKSELAEDGFFKDLYVKAGANPHSIPLGEEGMMTFQGIQAKRGKETFAGIKRTLIRLKNDLVPKNSEFAADFEKVEVDMPKWLEALGGDITMLIKFVRAKANNAYYRDLLATKKGEIQLHVNLLLDAIKQGDEVDAVKYYNLIMKVEDQLEELGIENISILPIAKEKFKAFLA